MRTALVLVLSVVAGCQCLPIDTNTTSTRSSPRLKAAERMETEQTRLNASEGVKEPLEVRGTVTCFLAYWSPDAYVIGGNAAAIYVNDEFRGAVIYAGGEYGRKDRKIDLTPFLTEGENAVRFAALIAKAPFGGSAPSTRAARVITDGEGAVISHRCFEREESGIEPVNEEWVLIWNPR